MNQRDQRTNGATGAEADVSELGNSVPDRTEPDVGTEPEARAEPGVSTEPDVGTDPYANVDCGAAAKPDSAAEGPPPRNERQGNGYGSSIETLDESAPRLPAIEDRFGETTNGGGDGGRLPVTDVPSIPGPVQAGSTPPPVPPRRDPIPPPPQPDHTQIPPPPEQPGHDQIPAPRQPSHDPIPPPPRQPGHDQTAAGGAGPIPPYGNQLTERPAIRPRHMRRGGPGGWGDTGDGTADAAATKRKLAMIGAATAPFALIGLIVVAWAIDNALHSGQVQRNVQLASHAVGGASEESLPGTIANVSDDTSDRDVVVVIKGEETPTDAAALGVTLDEQAMIDSAMDVGRSGSLFTRPFSWAKSFVSHRSVSPVYTVSETQISGALQAIQNLETEDSSTPMEPQVELTDGQFVVVPGRPGTDLDVSQAATDLLAAIDDSDDPDEAITLDTTTADVAPSIPDEQAQELADTANDLTESGVTLRAEGSQETLSTDQLRSWLTPVLTEDRQGLDFDSETAGTAVTELFGHLNTKPEDASISLAGGKPSIKPSQQGKSCCGEDVGSRVWETLESGQTDLEIEVKVEEPERTTEEVEGWGIKEPVGGNRAWRGGQGDVGGPKPGFTTFEVGSGGRAHNIRRMANEVNGAVIPPGGSFSINDHVGARQCPPYRADAGAIREGELIEECGGGTSQFATTMFNAAYWAGLDISGYKSHSRYFDRYPRGREATMGAPGSGLDVVVTNNTPYGVLIQTSNEGDTVTVTLWSTNHVQVEDAGNSESESGHCTIVTNTRKRTSGGSSNTDSFTARYSKVEGETC